MSMEVRSGGEWVNLQEAFLNGLCLMPIQDLLRESFHNFSLETRGLQPAAPGAFEAILERLDARAEVALALGLQAVLLECAGHLPLWALYQQRVSEYGYRGWWPGSFSGAGEPLKPRAYKTPNGNVEVKVGRYMDGPQGGIRPYEWHAELRLDSTSKEEMPDAVACGMVYVLERYRGMLRSTPNDLRWAADQVADTDVAQVLGFLQQHPDAEGDMEEGDLCFLWLWERKVRTPNGLGAEVLTQALKDLKKRFRSVRTLIVNLQPSQFDERALPSDPPEIEVARIDAIERIESAVRAMAPESALNGELRFIRKRYMTPQETMDALGSLHLDEMLGDED